MNKAFLREPEQGADYCPRCGAKGETVPTTTVQAQAAAEKGSLLAEPASFCPTASCEVVYFDSLGRMVRTSDLAHPVYPKDATAPLCACFGLTRDDIEADVREGAPTRTRAVLEKARSPQACCAQKAANGRSCVAYVQKYYLQCLAAAKGKTPET